MVLQIIIKLQIQLVGKAHGLNFKNLLSRKHSQLQAEEGTLLIKVNNLEFLCDQYYMSVRFLVFHSSEWWLLFLFLLSFSLPFSSKATHYKVKCVAYIISNFGSNVHMLFHWGKRHN